MLISPTPPLSSSQQRERHALADPHPSATPVGQNRGHEGSGGGPFTATRSGSLPFQTPPFPAQGQYTQRPPGSSAAATPTLGDGNHRTPFLERGSSAPPSESRTSSNSNQRTPGQNLQSLGEQRTPLLGPNGGGGNGGLSLSSSRGKGKPKRIRPTRITPVSSAAKGRPGSMVSA